MSFLSRDSPPTLSLFGPFVSRVTRVRRVFARVGGRHQLCTQSRAPVYETPGAADGSLRKGRHLKSGLAPAYLVADIESVAQRSNCEIPCRFGFLFGNFRILKNSWCTLKFVC